MKINFHACCGKRITKNHKRSCPERPELTPGYREMNIFREEARHNKFFAFFGTARHD